jgi:hypothetical protein
MPNGAGAVVAIYRYPIKGLSAEKMEREILTPGVSAKRSAIRNCTRFNPIRSGPPGVAAEDTFCHADAP